MTILIIHLNPTATTTPENIIITPKILFEIVKILGVINFRNLLAINDFVTSKLSVQINIPAKNAMKLGI